MNIFVGNLSFDANEGDVKKLFEGFGNVASVVIVMRKEKKAPKSRGFGFVQMPDEQQALAAMAAFNGKEFMGRVLNVEAARPKTEIRRENELKEKGKKSWLSPVFNKPGTYKGGRRTRSYRERHGLTGMQEEAKPRRRSQDNPMRWRKKREQPKPWQKSPGEHKPWEKAEGGALPWKKPAGDAKPWRKSREEAKPWKKAEPGIKPWHKPEAQAKPWHKPEGKAMPGKKSQQGTESWWKRAKAAARPLRRGGKRSRQTRFKAKEG